MAGILTTDYTDCTDKKTKISVSPMMTRMARMENSFIRVIREIRG